MWLYLTIHQHKKFLSTPSARRATRSSPSILTVAWISIHALREEGDLRDADALICFIISIHALREEGVK